MKYRIIVESEWLLHMLQNKIVPIDSTAPISTIKDQLQKLSNRFDVDEAQHVKDI